LANNLERSTFKENKLVTGSCLSERQGGMARADDAQTGDFSALAAGKVQQSFDRKRAGGELLSEEMRGEAEV
jgi:hypothetical protein